MLYVVRVWIEWRISVMDGGIVEDGNDGNEEESSYGELQNQLTVHRNVNGKINEPALVSDRSLRTKLESPIIPLVTLPNEQPFNMPGADCCVFGWYSLKHNRNAVAHCGHPVVFVFRILNGTPQQ